jgi:hypothetical protein
MFSRDEKGERACNTLYRKMDLRVTESYISETPPAQKDFTSPKWTAPTTTQTNASRFCPINKFGPEAIGLEILPLERIHDSLIQYEKGQNIQLVADHQARKKSTEDARARYKKEEYDKAAVQS